MVANLGLVFLGGGIGAVLRYLVGLLVTLYAKAPSLFGTLSVNALGAFFIGALAARMPKESVWLLFAVGGLGGFTTFSAFSLDTIELIRKGQTFAALAYTVGTCALCAGSCAVGIRLFGDKM